MKKLFIFLMIGIFLFSLTSAQETLGTFKQNDCVELKQTCSNCTYVNFTRVLYPDSTTALGNVEAEQDGSVFNYTFCNTSQLGTYVVYGIGDVDGTDTVFAYDFEITYSGKGLSGSQSSLYIVFLVVLILILIGTFFIMGYLPSSNETDYDGKILSISYLKYFRLVGWLFMYFLVIAIIFLSSNIALAYLNETLFGNLLFNLFQILMAMAPIIVIILVISFFVKFFHDKEFQRLLNRGIFPQGRL